MIAFGSAAMLSWPALVDKTSIRHACFGQCCYADLASLSGQNLNSNGLLRGPGLSPLKGLISGQGSPASDQEHPSQQAGVSQPATMSIPVRGQGSGCLASRWPRVS